MHPYSACDRPAYLEPLADTARCFPEVFRPRADDSHKGTHGTLALIGGAEGMSGALVLAATAAMYNGSGKVWAGFRQASLPMPIIPGRPEIMLSTAVELLERDGINTWVCGCGLGLDDEAAATLLHQLQILGREPLLLDADALSWLARQPQHRDNWVLTPHPGEAARLLGCSVAEVEADRLASVRALQRRYGGVVVLKGAGSLICDGQQLWLCTEGNPGMASGGMGDLLSGIIAALYAQGLPLATACCVGVCIHGEAADLAACAGERGLLASDLLPLIRRLVNPQDTMNHVSIPD